MKRWLCLALLAVMCGMGLTERMVYASEAMVRDRYGVTFYGIDLPKNGANLLLVIDASKSMKRKDAARKTAGRRWDTLLDEVRAMCEAMQMAIKERGVPFTVSVLFEGGKEAHQGIGPYDMAKSVERDTLITTLTNKEFLSGSNFKVTFGETLWAFVARHAITYVIYLGDDDIGTYATEVRTAMGNWYAGEEAKVTPELRKVRHQKETWRKAWAQWRPKKKGTLTFKEKRVLPPPPKEVTFSCVAIGQESTLLKELATLGKGQYIERTAKRKK